MNSGAEIHPHRVRVALRWDDDITFCGAYLKAENARQCEINGVVHFAASYGNGVESGDQIINALICSRVGEGLGHTL